MTDPKRDYAEAILSSASLDDLEWLVRGIDRSLIIDLVKRTKHLQRRVFPGFRPTHLPWARVPAALARDAQDNPQKLRSLLEMWLATNDPLCQIVTNELSVETIEDDTAELLASLDPEGRDRLLWALLLDGREEIQAALAEGLREALTNESSTLMIRAEHHRLVAALEEAHQEIADLKVQLEKLKKENRLFRRKAKQVDELQAEQQRLFDTVSQAKAQHQEAIRLRDSAHQKVEALQAELVREQARSHELQRSVDDLKASLEAIITSKQETANEVTQRLDETMTILEDARKENAKLRLKVSQLEEERSIAYDKRDEVRARAERLAAQLQRLKHDKEVIIAEKRELHAQLKQIEPELHKLRESLTAVEKEHETMLGLSHFDDAWDRAIDALSHHLTLMLSEQEAPSPTVRSDERWADWQSWQQMETALARPLLELSASVSAKDLANAEQAQKLLALRWYLLEWLKLSILETLRESNLTVSQVKSREEAK